MTILDGPRLDAPDTPRPPAAVPTDPTTLAPRWTALRYVLETSTSAARTALWRRLRAANALNLHQGVWAVPGPLGADENLTVTRHLDEAGAAWSTDAVGDGAEHTDLRLLLVDACDALWDPFSRVADRLARRLRSDQLDAAAALDVVELRRTFAPLAARDILGDATVRAADRLDELCGLCAADVPDEHRSPRPRRVSAAATFPLWDGRVRVVLRVDELPSFGWEQELRALEDYAFGTDPMRPSFRHGTVLVVCEPGQVDDAAARVAGRAGLLPVSR